MKRFLCALIIHLVIFPAVRSQFYSTGEAPASVKWSRITTAHFRLVFPENIAPTANRLANILEFYYPQNVSDLKSPLRRRMPVLLHHSSVNSNGYVTLAPARMELVTTPPQAGYPQDWLTQLALHESRHFIQLNRMHKGFTAFLGILTGQAGRGLQSAQVAPWFYEGDAVYNETRLSNTGRGRLPSFQMPLKTILNESGRIYSYDKSLFGSYRNFVPDQYQTGYQMVRYARTNMGDSVWSDVLGFSGRYPFLIWPMAIRLKTRYGYFNCGLYNETMKSLKTQYNNQINNGSSIDYRSINIRKTHAFTNYLGAKNHQNKLITFRTGFNDPGSFVYLDADGHEKKIVTTGTSSILKFDVRKDLLVWDEIQTDPRWAQRSYSVIRTMDLETTRIKTLTKKSRYFSPALSPDGTRIVVAENDEANQNFLTIIDSRTGKVQQKISLYEKTVVTPEWSGYSEIIYITVSPVGKQLESFNLFTRQKLVLIPETTSDFATPVAFGNYVLMSASFSGEENIYAIHKKNKNLYQVTKTKYGAKHPSVSADQKKLFFSNYGFDGYDLAEIPLDSNTWQALDPVVLEGLRKNDIKVPDDQVTEKKYDVRKYRRTLNLFNIHSWLPFYTDIDAVRDNPLEAELFPGVMLFSQNLLSTLTSTLGYHSDQGYHYFHPSFAWKGWYPVFEISADIGGPQKRLNFPGDIAFPANPEPYTEINLRMYLPLHYTLGKNHLFITPLAELEHSATYYNDNGSIYKGLNFIHFKFNASRLQRMSHRDIYPRFGQALALSFSKSVMENNQFGNMFSVQGTLYLPGLFRHHHLIIRGGYQKQNPAKYLLPLSRIQFPRGYTSSVSREFSSLILNYSLPLLYPDFAAGPLIYVKRIRANAFYDISYGDDIRQNQDQNTIHFTGYYKSTGIEVLADFHAFRLIFPIAAGVRLGYLPDQENIFSEFVVNMEIGSYR